MSRLVLVVASSFVISASSVAQAPNAPQSVTAALEQALESEPHDAVLAFFLAMFRAREGNRDGAYEALERTLRNGDGFLPTASTFPALADEPRFAVTRARFEKRLPRRVDAAVAFELHDRRLVPEGIAFDPVAQRFYVGSVAQNAIYRVGTRGTLERFSGEDAGLDAVLGISIDARARRLYAVSTNALTEGGRSAPRNAVKVFDLADGRLLHSFDVPLAVQLNDVAVGRDPMLFVTDSAGGGVWRIDANAGTVQPLAKLGTVRGANGIAVSPAGDVAYVAAARRPVLVDLQSGAVAPLRLPARDNAAAIDGLYFHRGALIGIQNFTTSGRIVRLELSADGRSVTRVDTLQSHHQAAFVEPTTAAIAPDGLYVLARTYVTRFNERGDIERPESMMRPLVLRIPLDAGGRSKR